MRCFCVLYCICCFLAVGVLCLSSPAQAAHQLQMTTHNGDTAREVFAAGETLYLDIKMVREASDLPAAACAFSLEYPQEQLLSPASEDINSFFAHSATNVARDTVFDKEVIYFSAAGVDLTTGGPPPQDSEVVLFTVRFTVRPNVIPGPLSFTLRETHLWHPNLGFGDDNGETPGSYDARDDTRTVAMLVGAAIPGTPGHNNHDCSQPPCAYPELMATGTFVHNSSSTVAGSVDAAVVDSSGLDAVFQDGARHDSAAVDAAGVDAAEADSAVNVPDATVLDGARLDAVVADGAGGKKDKDDKKEPEDGCGCASLGASGMPVLLALMVFWVRSRRP